MRIFQWRSDGANSCDASAHIGLCSLSDFQLYILLVYETRLRPLAGGLGCSPAVSVEALKCIILPIDAFICACAILSVPRTWHQYTTILVLSLNLQDLHNIYIVQTHVKSIQTCAQIVRPFMATSEFIPNPCLSHLQFSKPELDRHCVFDPAPNVKALDIHQVRESGWS